MAKEKKADSLGRVKSLGPKEPWQAALLLPKSWEDFRKVWTDFSRLPTRGSLAIRGSLVGQTKVVIENFPRMTGQISDGKRTVNFVVFGDTRILQAKLKEDRHDLILYGEAHLFRNEVNLRNIQKIPIQWLGRLRPVYPGKAKVINPDLARGTVLSLLMEAIPVAAHWLENELNVPASELAALGGCPGWSLEQILKIAHLPATPELGRQAQEALERFSALGAIRSAAKYRTTGTLIDMTHVRRLDPQKFSNRIPFPLVNEQQTAINDILVRVFSGQPLRHFLSGDVGTGKTAVYATVAASLLAGGARIAIMLPNQALAAQVAREMSEWWPKMPMTFVSGDSDTKEDLTPIKLLIGTQALLHRDIGPRDLLIVDEQQKFSREQREQLLQKESHLLEVTATCIPRSQALVRYGVMTTSKLKEGHVKKEIFTKIRLQEDRQELFSGVKQTLLEKAKVLVVYPRRAANEETDCDLPSAEEAYKQWDRLFPGRVRLAHGGQDGAVNNIAIAEMRTGDADILISTSIVEVGINIPDLRRVVVVHAERFGLSTLHQIRGRIARNGGIGHCDLYLPKKMSEEVTQRMQVLERTCDGFEVAEQDMRIRGFGNLSSDSDKQTGADDTFLFGRSLRPELLDELLELLETHVLSVKNPILVLTFPPKSLINEPAQKYIKNPEMG